MSGYFGQGYFQKATLERLPQGVFEISAKLSDKLIINKLKIRNQIENLHTNHTVTNLLFLSRLNPIANSYI